MTLANTNLKSNDLLGAIEIVGNLQHCQTAEDFCVTALNSSLKYIGAETSVFFLDLEKSNELQSPSLSRGVSVGGSPDVLRRYLDTYNNMDPVIEHIANSSPCRQTDVFRLEDILDYRNLIDSQYYQEFLLPSSIHYLLAVRLATRTRNVGIMGLHRPKSGKPFSRGQLEKAKLIAPLLAMAVERMLCLDESQKTDSLLRALEAEYRSKAIMILDSDFSPVYRSKTADEYLATSTPSIMNSLRTLIDSWRCAVETSVEREGSKPRSLTVRTPLGSGLCVTRLERRTTNSNGTYWSIRLLGRDGDNRTVNERIAMTPRRAEIAKLVAGGLSNKEIAGALRISVKTVENHLYTMYRELGVSNRTMFVSVLGQRA